MKTATQKPKPSVYDFHNYRAFIKAWLLFQKDLAHGISIRELGRLANISASHMSAILLGRRPMSRKMFDAISPHLDIAKADLSFLWHLVLLADSDSLQERNKAFQKLTRFGIYRDKHKNEIETHEYMQAWYYMAIRELSGLSNFKLDPKWIRKKLRYNVTINEIKEALSFLIKHNYIMIDPATGQARDLKKLIRVENEVLRLSMAHFHGEVLDLAGKSIYTTPSEERQLLNYMLSLPQSAFPEVSQILQETLQKITAISNDPKNKKTDSVYNITLYAFPLTHGEDPSDSDEPEDELEDEPENGSQNE